jgi:uncharacterized OsmC-like protein
VSDTYRVELRTFGSQPTGMGIAGPFHVIVDRPAAAGGGGLGFSGGQLLYMAIAACYSNDLYREAATRGITLSEVRVEVDGDFPARGQGSTPIAVSVTLRGDAPDQDLNDLLDEVDRIAEIPNSIRGATAVTLTTRNVASAT